MKTLPKRAFAPGCALMLYKPLLAQKVHSVLNELCGEMEMHSICCKHEPQVQELTEIINICPGCDKRFMNDYPDTSTVSLWEVLASCDRFPFPDYQGRVMSILDACPTRGQDRIHNAVRTLLGRMNITISEPDKTMTKSVCCGDSFYGMIPLKDLKDQMKKRAADMPAEEVVVYCVSCINSMQIGGKQPRYLVDLLFGESTTPRIIEPDDWHQAVDLYIEKH